MPPKPRPWRRRLGYTAFFILALLFGLRQTFPFDALKEKAIIEAGKNGFRIDLLELGPSGLAGVRATGLVVEPMSMEGLKIPLDQLDLSVSLLPLVAGHLNLSFDARAFGGRVKGGYEQSKTAQRVIAKADDLDLAAAQGPVKKLSGLDLGGTIKADIDVTLDLKEPAKSDGHIDLDVGKAVVNGGDVPVASMGGTVSLPKMVLGDVTARATVKDGKANFEKLEAKSEDLELSGEGIYFQVQPRLEYAPLFGKVKLKLNDAFWNKSGTAGFKGIAEMALASAKGPDGFYRFQIFGTLGHPQGRPGAGR